MSAEGGNVDSVVSDRISMALPEPRLERVRAWMAASELDALVVTSAALVNWVTGYSRYYGGPTAAVIGPAGERTLVVMRDEADVAGKLSDADSVSAYGERGFGLELNPLPLLVAEVLRTRAVASASRVGVAGDFATAVTEAVSAPTVAADDALHQMSLVKDPDELVKIFRSYELCWLAHTAIAAGTAAGASEIEMMSAAQSADLSVGADGYWADTCRTYVNGSSAEVDEIRAQLYGIMDSAAADLRTGATGAAVFGGIKDRIAAAWPEGEFPHHGGHGVGLTVFDDPHVIPAEDRTVASWMVMALEPGVYLPGRFGVRTENLFLVTPEGAVELAQAMARPLSPQALTTWSR
jgi:Xaa-Pro aminopeptidase